ncbi:MAG: double-strand break repair protein AddB, partial [Hyphomicrobiales bacterium]|nr:double-strand break repair protein AddB [Hyphomicrobiales bacterium]
MSAGPRVFTIPAGAPFLATFAKAALDGAVLPGLARGRGPLGLASATIYVPTRRAAAGLRDALVDALGGAALLPRIAALGALDGVETGLLLDGREELAAAAGLAPAIGELPRRLALARLVQAFAERLARTLGGPAESPVGTGGAQAMRLAAELAGLVDEMTIEGVDWSRLEDLRPDGLDEFWRITAAFAAIAAKAWPDALAEAGMSDAAARRNALIDAETARLAAGADPV